MTIVKKESSEKELGNKFKQLLTHFRNIEASLGSLEKNMTGLRDGMAKIVLDLSHKNRGDQKKN